MTPHADAVLLDTDILSFLFNQDPVRVPRYEAHLDGRTLYASFVSVAEMRFGALIRNWGPARLASLETYFRRYRIVESTPEIGAAWAEIRAHVQRIGRPTERGAAVLRRAGAPGALPSPRRAGRDRVWVPVRGLSRGSGGGASGAWRVRTVSPAGDLFSGRHEEFDWGGVTQEAPGQPEENRQAARAAVHREGAGGEQRVFGAGCRLLIWGADLVAIRGSCACGAVTYEITGAFNFVGNCHCPICRKANGAAFVTWGILEPGQFRWTSGEEALHAYQSSEDRQRWFCGRCGSSLGSSHPGAITEVVVGTVDGDPGALPREHIFVGSKAPWYEIADALPQYEEWPPGMES